MTANDYSLKTNDKSVESIKQSMLEKMEPKIKKVLRTIPVQYREDVEQDIKLKMILSLENIKYEQLPSLLELLKEEANTKHISYRRDK